jgi:protease-4
MDYATPPPFGAPPPLPPPPVISPSAPARPPRRWGWIVVSIVLFVLLGFSVLLNVGGLFSGMATVSGPYHRAAGPRMDEVVVEEHRGSEKIAVVPVEGIISSYADRGGFSLVDVVKAQLKRAAEDDDVKALILRVDSPGGEVLASDDIARYIREFQEKSGKPVVVSMGGLAASGGYFVAAPGDWIVAHELTITGSIGVIMQSWNYRGLMNKVGLKPDVYKSGKFKDMLSGQREAGEIPPEERAMVQKLIDETYAKFKQVVADGRKLARENTDEVRALQPDWANYADGRILSGKEALEIGFVDELGTFDDAVSRAEKMADLTRRATLIEYRQRVDFGDLFGLWGQSESRAIKVDLGIEPPKLEAGRLYFLSPSYLY